MAFCVQRYKVLERHGQHLLVQPHGGDIAARRLALRRLQRHIARQERRDRLLRGLLVSAALFAALVCIWGWAMFVALGVMS